MSQDQRDSKRLLDCLFTSHDLAALRNQNVSSQLIRAYSAAGVEFHVAVSAAILSMGALHAPVTKAREILYRTTEDSIRDLLRSGKRLPGFGNSFFKDSIDPSFSALAKEIETFHVEHHANLLRVGRIVMEERGIVLYPNAAAFTAICAEILGYRVGSELFFVISGRIRAWENIWQGSR